MIAGDGRRNGHVGYIMKAEQTKYIRTGCESGLKDGFMVSERMGMIFMGEEDFGKIRFDWGWNGGAGAGSNQEFSFRTSSAWDASL